YIGGSGPDEAGGVSVDQDHNVYVLGNTQSEDLPTASAFQPTYGGSGSFGGDLFLVKVAPDEVISPTLLAIYALAYDNQPESDGNLTPYYYASLEPIVDASRTSPDKTAIVLADLDGEGDTQIHIVHQGVITPVLGLPDATGVLSPTLREYNMTDGTSLGGFLLWARRTHPATTTVFSYVGHNAPLVPAAEAALILGPGVRAARSNAIPVPTWWVAHPDVTDEHPRRLLSAYELARALEIGNQGRSPIAVLDLINCFAGSIEQLYELAPYVSAITASPNYTYLDPAMLGQVLGEISPSTAPRQLAQAIVGAYDAILPTTDHPRLLVAVDSAQLLAIKPAWDSVSGALYQALQEDFAGTRSKLENAYQASTKYDSSFCPPVDWSLAPPDALSDLGSFAQQLSIQFGPSSEVGQGATTTQARLQAAILARHSRDGIPWFTAPATPGWSFAGSSGIALYTDFQALSAHGKSYLNWQAHWYTSTPGSDNPFPFAFLRPVTTAYTWADVFATFWSQESVATWTCLPAFPVVQRTGELAVSRIVLPLPGMVTRNAPTTLAAEITTSEVADRVRVRFEVVENSTLVFSNTITVSDLATGTHTLRASRSWVPGTTGLYRLTVTVDPDGRYTEGNEANNTLQFEDTVQPENSRRPQIQAAIPNNQQWFAEPAISLQIEPVLSTQRAAQAIFPPEALAIQIYQHSAASLEVPIEVAEVRLPLTSFPTVTLPLPPEVKPGLVILHIWATSGRGAAADPIVLTFNYAPPEAQISSGEVHYYRFAGQVNERLLFGLESAPSDGVRLFLWTPNHYGLPDLQLAPPQTNSLLVAAPLSGAYLLAVQGQAAASSRYTLAVTLTD
ncbi:MAG: hypothetical protein H0T73_14075, partial [Ardenticatenales bacterium]|nr:hypothetical protein [Ardenticatenales bacterium]